MQEICPFGYRINPDQPFLQVDISVPDFPTTETQEKRRRFSSPSTVVGVGHWCWGWWRRSKAKYTLFPCCSALFCTGAGSGQINKPYSSLLLALRLSQNERRFPRDIFPREYSPSGKSCYWNPDTPDRGDVARKRKTQFSVFATRDANLFHFVPNKNGKTIRRENTFFTWPLVAAACPLLLSGQKTKGSPKSSQAVNDLDFSDRIHHQGNRTY